ncbi:CobQ/CobB/MinD/ParA nucleotide binding domain protein (plasmid) [Borreliella finlandensis]|uniref:CobQ/CobB/MinD/ParA nucleotide binding domain protein n=1 Tax=Borreliella finlandensis TaxID=498741 RepID=A0A826GQ87_9SPIR|nr:CobQ/CobB/MinD/ParA nucleotide binding domain protein [Borreliella finlandensis]
MLIDIDTQASTTSYFYEKIKENNIDLEKNICEVLKDNLGINDTIINLENNLNLIPGYLTLHSLNGDFHCLNKHKAIDLKLKNPLEIKRLKINYDYILIDTNPSLDLTLRCALNATHYIAIPMTAGKWTF